jgi:hypothetical protein
MREKEQPLGEAQETGLNEIIRLFQYWASADARFRPIDRSDSSWERPCHLAISCR